MIKQPLTDTVAALSTPPGKGGVALIRVCGEDAVAAVEKHFKTRSGASLSSLPPRQAIYGDFFYKGDLVDDLLVTVFRAPHSYTGEDTVELTTHGSMLICRTILEALYADGVRPADRGEFTRRAFLAGKLTLSEAEAIAELLDAKSTAQLKLFRRDARSHLSSALETLYGGISALLSAVYAKVDYPDEDLAELSREEMLSLLSDLMKKAERLLSTYQTGRAMTEGIYTVLLGKPNTGKSSLYNLLLGREAAIVTEYAGTTRDVLEDSATLGRVLLRLADTAGVHEADNPVEKLGVERTKETLARADLILLLFDTSRPFDADDEALIALAKEASGRVIALLNKCDLKPLWSEERLEGSFAHVLPFSTKEGALTALESLINELFTDGTLTAGEDAILFTARQNAALLRALDLMQNAYNALAEGFPEDAALCELEVAAAALAESDGRSVSEDVVSGIFSKFCVGK